PAAQPVFAAVSLRRVCDRHRERAAGVAHIPFFDFWRRCLLPASDSHFTELRFVAKGRIERKADLAPQADVARWPAFLGHMTALKVAKMTDVMHGLIAAFSYQGKIVRFGQHRPLGEQGIEDDFPAAIAFPPDAEESCELLAYRIPRFS